MHSGIVVCGRVGVVMRRCVVGTVARRYLGRVIDGGSNLAPKLSQLTGHLNRMALRRSSIICTIE